MVSPGVFRVDAFLVLDSPTQKVTALQLDFDVDTNGQGSLATPPGFRTPNTTRDDGSDFVVVPFDLTNTSDSIGDPSGAIDVRMVYAASSPFDIAGINATIASHSNCAGACTAQDAGLAAGNNLYLGSFNINVPNGALGTGGPVVKLRLPANAIFGEDDDQPQNGVDPLVQQLRAFAGGLENSPVLIERGLQVTGLVPEPTGLALMGTVLAALSLVRRRS
jgi:hypothetical protein